MLASALNILSQCYDGVSVMSVKHGVVQKILQDQLNHLMPRDNFKSPTAFEMGCTLGRLRRQNAFFNVCSSLYKLFGKPTAAAQHTGENLRLLDQRCSGHLGTVSVILKSSDREIK